MKKINKEENIQEKVLIEKEPDLIEGVMEQWDNPFTKEQLDSWKKKYGKIFKNYDDENNVYVWRKIKRSEYVEIMKFKSEDEKDTYYKRQEMMAKKVLLYPENVDEAIDDNAYLATVLSEFIIEKSGFIVNTPEEL